MLPCRPFRKLQKASKYSGELNKTKVSYGLMRLYNQFFSKLLEKYYPSYNLDLLNVMQHSHTVDRPVKVANFHEKIYEFSKKPVWTLGNQSKEYSAKLIPFETVKRIVEKMNQITSLQEVPTKIMIGGTVNMIIYIDLKEAEPVKINTQYGIKKKQEVIEYDNSYRDQIKFTLCNAHIDSIAKNGVYKPQYVKVNSFNDKYLKKKTKKHSSNSYQRFSSRN